MSVSAESVDSQLVRDKVGWPSVKLSECCEIVSGGTPKSSEASYWGGEILWVTPKDLTELNSKYISSTLRTITESGYAKSSANMLPAESVLFSSRAPIGHVAINTVPMCTNQGFKSLVPDTTQIFADYLYYWLRANKAQLQALGNGATFKEVSKTVISEVEIPLPPLPEQRRIAAILDKADALRQKRREAIAKLDQLLQSVFLEMFGDPLANPYGFRIETIGQVLPVGTGSTPSRQSPVNFGGQTPWVKSTEVDWREISTTSETVSEEGVSSARLKLYPRGTIILAMYGQGKTRGKTGVLGVNATINQACCAIVPNDRVRGAFLFHYLKGSYLRLRGLGRGGNQENLNLSIVKDFPLPVPPIDLQKKFSRVIDSVSQSTASARQSLIRTDELCSSLQQRAFTGQL